MVQKKIENAVPGSSSIQVAWVTGSASGLGRHLTGALLGRGWQVLATDINEVALRQAAQEDHWSRDRGHLMAQDIRDSAQWQACLDFLLARAHQLDLMLNVAGYLLPGFIHEVSDEAIDRHLQINVQGLMLGCRTAARQMIQQGSGHIVNIASLGGLMAGPGLGLYCASKFAVRGFSLALAQELRPRGISVTVICPDAIDTPMLALQADYDEAAMTFGGRVLGVEEIERVLFHNVLRKKPIEVALPFSRVLLARLASFWPPMLGLAADAVARKGRRRQRNYRNRLGRY